MYKVNGWPHINQPWPWARLATLTRKLTTHGPQINKPIRVPTVQATPACNGPPCLRPQNTKSLGTQPGEIIEGGGTCCPSHRAFPGASHLPPGSLPPAGHSLELLGSTFACSIFGSQLPLPLPTLAPSPSRTTTERWGLHQGVVRAVWAHNGPFLVIGSYLHSASH